MTNEEAIEFAVALKNNYTINFDQLEEFCDKAIKALTVQTSEETHETEGIWLHDIYNNGNWHDIPTICSECGHKYTEYVCGYEWEETGDLPNFCPHCGKKMREETDEELEIRRSEYDK